MDRPCRGAGLSQPPDDDDRAVPGRGCHRHGGAIPGRTDAGHSRSIRHYRECRRRRRKHRRRPRRSFARRRLHAQYRHVDHAYADRWPLHPSVRSVEGSGTGDPDRQRAAVDRRQKEPAGQRPEGVDRVSQGQSRQGLGRRRRRRRGRSSRRYLISKGDRNQVSVRALSRQCAGHAGSSGGPDRFHDRAVVEFQIAGRKRQHQALCRHRPDAACLRRRKFRRRTRPGCPVSLPRCGTDCGCPGARRRTSSPD